MKICFMRMVAIYAKKIRILCVYPSINTVEPSSAICISLSESSWLSFGDDGAVKNSAIKIKINLFYLSIS